MNPTALREIGRTGLEVTQLGMGGDLATLAKRGQRPRD